MNMVVTDTGPLLHLHQVEAAHVLAYLGIITDSSRASQLA